MAGGEFKVIFICTGNQARSAIAESYFRSATKGLPVTASSAGLLELTVTFLPYRIRCAPPAQAG